MTAIAITRTTDLGFDDAARACRNALSEEGFGILTEIDVAATLKAKLDVDRDPYLILGACHPPSADQVLQHAPEAGVLLPCNVTVSVEEGTTVIRAMDPASAMTMLDSQPINEIADDIRQRLSRAIRSID